MNQNLTKEQKDVLFNKKTEVPFTGKFFNNKEKGIYTCANCNAELFSSDRKYDAHCGWPSFDDVYKEGSIKFIEDTSHNMQRIETVCANCGGHLGHVFDDGPEETTGKRYCINSLSLDFKKYQTEQIVAIKPIKLYN